MCYFHDDRQGSVMTVTDNSGAALSKYRYDPWGRRSIVTGAATGIDATRQGHTGHEMLEIGLTHMNGRLYDAELARFVSADPLVQAPYDLQSLNRYSYVFNDPLGYTDPSGYESEHTLTGMTVEDRRWQSVLSNTPEPVYTPGGDWSGNSYGVPYSPAEFAKRFDNLQPVGQSEEPVLPTMIVTDKRESDIGKVADMVIDLTPFGYLVSVRNSVAGRTLVGNEELGPWERMLGFIPFAGPIRKVGGAALDVVKNIAKEPIPTTKQLEKFKKQLQEHGPKSLERSQRKIELRLSEHIEKLEQIKRDRGHTSSVEREIRNFERELEAINKIRKGDL